MSTAMRYGNVFVLILIICRFNDARDIENNQSSSEFKILNRGEVNGNVNEGGSEQKLFLNLGARKKWKVTQSKLENTIIKSKIEVLGEIFRKRVDYLKADNKVSVWDFFVESKKMNYCMISD